MRVAMDGEQVLRGITTFQGIGLVIVDIDEVWDQVLAVGPPERPDSWARWYHHLAHRKGWRPCRTLILVSACYSVTVDATERKEDYRG